MRIHVHHAQCDSQFATLQTLHWDNRRVFQKIGGNLSIEDLETSIVTCIGKENTPLLLYYFGLLFVICYILWGPLYSMGP
jgi:hypothetical protein